MKKACTLFLALALLLALTVPALAANVAYPVEGGQIFFDLNTGTITGYDGTAAELVIPSEIYGVPVTTLGLQCMVSEEFERVVIPESVTTIEHKSFSECPNLKEITIPATVTYMGRSVFEGCSSLEKATVNASITKLPYEMFQGCTSLKEVTLPAGLKSIGNGAFAGSGLETVDFLPEGLEEIIGSAFAGCKQLRRVVIPDGVTVIEEFAFNGCRELTEISFGNGIKSIGRCAFYKTGLTGMIVFPESLKSIADNAFDYSSITGIWLPAGIESNYGFPACLTLTDVYYAGTLQQWAEVDAYFNLSKVTVHFDSPRPGTSAAPVTPAPAAPVVQLSPQNLSVNGAAKDVEKYNIDGSNYFKLRDIAYLLSGTGSQFSVGWDAATSTVSIVTGAAYEPNGSEMIVGADKSATAVASAQTIRINGVARPDLSVYNLDGNNFFKLRDLGDALGFTVDYDAATNTAVVISK